MFRVIYDYYGEPGSIQAHSGYSYYGIKRDKRHIAVPLRQYYRRFVIA